MYIYRHKEETRECFLYRNGSKCQGLFRKKVRPRALASTDNGLPLSHPKGDGSCQNSGMNSHLTKHFSAQVNHAKPKKGLETKASREKCHFVEQSGMISQVNTSIGL